MPKSFLNSLRGYRAGEFLDGRFGWRHRLTQSSSAEIGGSLQDSPPTKSSQVRSRRAANKEPSFNHLSLVTRFQLSMNAPSPNETLTTSPLLKSWSCNTSVTRYGHTLGLDRCRRLLHSSHLSNLRSKTGHQSNRTFNKLKTHKQLTSDLSVRQRLSSADVGTRFCQQKAFPECSRTHHLHTETRRQLTPGLTTLNSSCSSQVQSPCLAEKLSPHLLMSTLAFASPQDITLEGSPSGNRSRALAEETGRLLPQMASLVVVSGSPQCAQEKGCVPQLCSDLSAAVPDFLIPVAVLQPLLFPLDGADVTGGAELRISVGKRGENPDVFLGEREYSSSGVAWVSAVAAAVSASDPTFSSLDFISLALPTREDNQRTRSPSSNISGERSGDEDGSTSLTAGTAYTHSHNCAPSLAAYVFSLSHTAGPDCHGSHGPEGTFDRVRDRHGHVSRESQCTRASSIFPKKRGRQCRKADAGRGACCPDDNDVLADSLTSPVLTTDASSSSRAPCHECPDCQLQFPRPADLSAHLLTHSMSGARNKCVVCSRVFTRSWLLKGHMRTHTGERPFRCSFPHCNKAFADKSNLRSHTLIHTTSSKSFVCPKCGRAFSQKRYLHKHMLEVCRII